MESQKERHIEDFFIAELNQKVALIEDKIANGEPVDSQDVTILFIQTQYESMNRLDSEQRQINKRISNLERSFEGLRGEINTKFESLRGEVNTKIEELRGEFNELRGEVTSKIESLKTDIQRTTNSDTRWVLGTIPLIVVGFKLLDMIIK